MFLARIVHDLYTLRLRTRDTAEAEFIPSHEVFPAKTGLRVSGFFFDLASIQNQDILSGTNLDSVEMSEVEGWSDHGSTPRRPEGSKDAAGSLHPSTTHKRHCGGGVYPVP
jgi:hypothetical protein